MSAAISDDQRPLAPASWLVLAGVVAYVLLASFIVSITVSNDYAAIFSFVAVVLGAVFVLNKSGKERAEAHPNPLYQQRRLPSDENTGKWRALMIALTLVILITIVTITAKPGESGEPFPYFVALAFLYLVMPQLTARLALRRASRR